jgi:hypothetical protein
MGGFLGPLLAGLDSVDGADISTICRYAIARFLYSLFQ